MVRVGVICVALAIVAAFFGFGDMGDYSWGGARVLFLIFFVLAAMAFLGGASQRRPS